MKKIYKFNYDFGNAEVSFEVDLNRFTYSMANDTLEFFTWGYDPDADPIDEVMIKYAISVIKMAMSESLNKYGIMNAFQFQEGYYLIDGSDGILLTQLEVSDFDTSLLECEIKIID